MKTSYPFSFAALKMRSMFSTVLFSVTLWPTNPHASPLSLSTSFCGSINTTAVSFLLTFMDYLLFLGGREGDDLSPCCTRLGMLFANHSGLKTEVAQSRMPIGTA